MDIEGADAEFSIHGVPLELQTAVAQARQTPPHEWSKITHQWHEDWKLAAVRFRKIGEKKRFELLGAGKRGEEKELLYQEIMEGGKAARAFAVLAYLPDHVLDTIIGTFEARILKKGGFAN